jgi:hypothetical protein
MKCSLSQAFSTLRAVTVASCLAAFLVVGCGRSDTAPPVSEEDVEELELDFDSGTDTPFDAPDASDDAADDEDYSNEAP